MVVMYVYIDTLQLASSKHSAAGSIYIACSSSSLASSRDTAAVLDWLAGKYLNSESKLTVNP